MNFYLIVLSVAVVIFVSIMVWFTYTLNYTTTTTVYPPVSSSCPDSWTSSISDSTLSCVNTGTVNIGTGLSTSTSSSYPAYTYTETKDTAGNVTATTHTILPNSTKWNNSGLTTKCGQKLWTDTYGIQWNGVSNYNGC